MSVAREGARTPSRSAVLAVVCLALFMALLDSTAISLALPAIRSDLEADMSGLVWIADGYVLIFACALLTSGTLGDRLGRSSMFLTGLAVFTLGSAVCALAPGLPALVSGRVIQGLGAAIVTPQTLAILTHAFPDPKERAKAFGIWSGVSGLALLIGPVLGGALVDVWGWRSIFWVNVPVGVLALVLGARTVRPLEAGRPPRTVPLRQIIDLPGQVLTVVSLASLTYVLIEGGRIGWGSPVVIGLLLLAVVAFAALMVVERRTEHPMLHLELFRERTFNASTIVIALLAFGMYASFFLISLFLQQVQRYAPAEAGVRFLPAMAAVMVVAPFAGVIAGKVGSRLPVVVGALLTGGSLLLMARVGEDQSYGSWWPLLVGFGLGVGLVIPPVNNALMGSVPKERAGLASATGETGQQVGALVGIAVLGAVVADGFQRVVAARVTVPGVTDAEIALLARSMFSTSDPNGPSTFPVVGAVVRDAMTSGIHRGLAAGGVALVLAALVGLLIREDRGAPVPEVDGEPAAEAGPLEPATR